jgi:asparagine synthase (glutamine-hydrolysing)
VGGIAALYTWDAPVDLMLLARLERAMSHRGSVADQWSDGPVGLAMRDWESVEQTGMLQGRECWIAADARLDYRTDLVPKLAPHTREELAHASDARLIGLSYLLWGEACVQRLEGDYAFILWDGTQQRLFGARSPVGLRPFVYALFPHRRFLCASEPEQLLEDEQLSRDLNPSWVAYWLT